MSDTSFIKVIDEGLRALVWSKFRSDMGFSASDLLAENIILYPKLIALRKISEKRSRTQLEFMNIWRSTTSFDWTRQRTPLARRGLNIVYTDSTGDSAETAEDTGVITVKSTPVSLGYDIWFWSKSLEVLNTVDERYLFWIHNNPNLNLLYDDKYAVNLDLHFGEIIDESPLENVFSSGTYFIHRAPVKIDGWIFSSVTAKTIKTIYLTIYDENDTEDVEEFVLDPDESLELYTETITEDS